MIGFQALELGAAAFARSSRRVSRRVSWQVWQVWHESKLVTRLLGAGQAVQPDTVARNAAGS